MLGWMTWLIDVSYMNKYFLELTNMPTTFDKCNAIPRIQ